MIVNFERILGFFHNCWMDEVVNCLLKQSKILAQRLALQGIAPLNLMLMLFLFVELLMRCRIQVVPLMVEAAQDSVDTVIGFFNVLFISIHFKLHNMFFSCITIFTD